MSGPEMQENDSMGMTASVAYQQTILRAFLLPEMYRDVLLCDLQGRKPRETATILGISAKAVELRLQRARKLMQNLGRTPSLY